MKKFDSGNITKKIADILLLLLIICCLGMFLLLSVFSLFFKTYLENPYDVILLFEHNNLLVELGFVVLYSIVIFLVNYCYRKLFKSNIPLLIFVCAVVFVGSLAFIYFIKSFPAADSAMVYDAAKAFSKNNLSAVAYRESYFSAYPFQLGLAFFYEMIYRIVPSDSFHIVQGINAIFLVGIIYSQYQLIYCYFKDKETQVIYLLLIVAFLPFILYAGFVYGEIPSMFFLSLGTLLVSRFLETSKWIFGVGAILAGAGAMIVRKNSLIYLIAFGIIMFIFYMKHFADYNNKKRIETIVFIILFLVVVYFSLPMVIKSYEMRSGNKTNDGVPASTYLAMGLMETTPSGVGNYNGYNLKTFTENADYDSAKASEIGWNQYRLLIKELGKSPLNAGNIFFRKITNQWMNSGYGIYSCLHWNSMDKLEIVEKCFSGEAYGIIINYMSCYQLMIYLLGFAFFGYSLVKYKKEKITVEAFVFPLTVFGGFLFSLIWEASGRYVFPYAVFIVPFCAKGFTSIKKEIMKNVKKR